MKTITIKQGAMIPAPPSKVYRAFLDAKQHSVFTGATAKISAKVGGTFSVWDGYAHGRNIELIPGKKIVQSWRASDWPEGHDSQITILLRPAPGGTKLLFSQHDVPSTFAKDIAQGWKEYYWEPFKKFFEA